MLSCLYRLAFCTLFPLQTKPPQSKSGRSVGTSQAAPPCTKHGPRKSCATEETSRKTCFGWQCVIKKWALDDELSAAHISLTSTLPCIKARATNVGAPDPEHPVAKSMARVLGRTATFKKLVARSRNEVKQNFLWVNIRVGTFLVVSGVDDGVLLTFLTELDDAAGL